MNPSPQLSARRFGTPRVHARRYLGWRVDLDEDTTPPPHGWRQCACARDELAALTCKCPHHGAQPLPFSKRRHWKPGLPYACIIDFTTRERKSPGQLNRERRARIAVQRQPRLL